MANKTTFKLIVFFVFLLSESSFSQYTKYWIQFADKNNNPYDISSPSQYLSARAIQRRQNQNIKIAINDLPITPAYIDSVKKVPGVTVLNRSKWFNAITIFTTDTNAVNKIEKFSFVVNAKGVQRYHRKQGVEGNIKPIQLSSLKIKSANQNTYNYGPSLNQIDMIGGVCMHNKGFTGEGMQIAVLDAGFSEVDSLPIFDSLRTNKQILGTWDFVDNDSGVYTEHSHGTMVLSTMGGNDPGLIVGTAPKAKYWLLRTEAGATEFVIEEDNWISGAEFADSVGVDILTTSLGYTTFDSIVVNGSNVVNPDNHTYKDMNGNTCRISIGTDIAVSKGMFAVCSAGNSGGSPWNFIGAPADADSVLAVGSVDSLKRYSTFSSQGPSYDGRIKPNVVAQGQDAVVANAWGGGGVIKANGTSFSGPITAGMVACLWQAHPTLTNMQLLNSIQQTASQFSTPDGMKGYGVSDFCAANSALSVIDKPAYEGDVLEVYPNPFGESTTLLVKGIKAYGLVLTVFDLIGNMVHQQTLNAQSVTLNLKLAKGVYVLEVKDGNTNYSAKLVKY
jgi:serine protease AprX